MSRREMSGDDQDNFGNCDGTPLPDCWLAVLAIFEGEPAVWRLVAPGSRVRVGASRANELHIPELDFDSLTVLSGTTLHMQPGSNLRMATGPLGLKVFDYDPAQPNVRLVREGAKFVVIPKKLTLVLNVHATRERAQQHLDGYERSLSQEPE